MRDGQGQAGKEADGNTKTKKEGGFFVGWKETREPHRKLGYD